MFLTLSMFWWSQILVGIALVSDIISWQCRRREVVLSWITVSTLLVVFHWVLLEKYTAAAVLGIGALRYFISIFSTARYWLPIFFGATLVATWFTYKAPLDLLVMVVSLVFHVAAFHPVDRRVREISMGGSSMIVVYNFLAWSPTAMVVDGIFLFSNLVGYWRFYLRKK